MAQPLTPRFVLVGSAGVTRPDRPGIDVDSEPPAVRMNDQLGGILTYKLAGADSDPAWQCDCGPLLYTPFCACPEPAFDRHPSPACPPPRKQLRTSCAPAGCPLRLCAPWH